jgi:hypothetical protein
MVHPNELRIGNFLQWQNSEVEDNYFNVTSVESDYDWYEEAESIEITVEWLLKFGFKYYQCGSNSHLTYICPNDIYYLQKDGNTEWRILYKSDLEFIDFTIGFNDVHKLQNLYYLLTGEELTFCTKNDHLNVSGMNTENDFFYEKVKEYKTMMNIGRTETPKQQRDRINRFRCG